MKGYSVAWLALLPTANWKIMTIPFIIEGFVQTVSSSPTTALLG
jgi:hypothetical protein